MTRHAEHDILPLILERHSPRAMSGQVVSESDLLRVLEAARWAPSAGNSQPWRFLYARADSPHFPRFLDYLDTYNRDWCVRAGALLIVLSKTTTTEGKPLSPHAFDAGAAWMALALQAYSMGLVVHAMGGIFAERIRAEMDIPADFAIHVMVALGHPGDPQLLSERNRPREAPNDRRPLAETIADGQVPAQWRDDAR